MKREDDDVFEPTPALVSRGAPGGPSLDPLDDPPPGPTSAWTARGVIEALEPLTLPERRERLRQTLGKRLDSVTVVLDSPHDPHNGSAVLRSCDAFGIQRVHVVRSHEAFAASRMVAKGSQRWVDIIDHSSVEAAVDLLRRSGFRLLVTHPEGRLVPEDLPRLGRVALVLGNERDGVSEELTRACDDTLRIPMCGFVESLNVSVTAAILAHAACHGRPGDLSERRAQNVYARWLRNSVPRADEVLGALEPC
jgi:tRNA (guanosine-2'-O-)-methyltransferase